MTVFQRFNVIVSSIWTILSVLFFLLFLLVRFGVEHEGLGGQQWPVAILMWISLLGPGFVVGLAMLLKAVQLKQPWQYRLGWFLSAVVVATVITTIPMAIFFAHDAPNNYSFFMYIGKLLVRFELYLLWIYAFVLSFGIILTIRLLSRLRRDRKEGLPPMRH